MTTQFTVSSGCAAQTGWTGTVNFDIGIVADEPQRLKTGLEALPEIAGKAESMKGINIMGQSRNITIKGKFYGSSLADAQNFERNLKLMADYQLFSESGSADATFKFYNTESRIYDVATSPGLQVMMKEYSTNSPASSNVITVHYTIIVQNLRSINSI